MSEPAGPLTRPAAVTTSVGLVALHVLLQLLAVMNPDVAFHDMEERFNPMQSLLVLDGHWEALFVSQYRHFCGGCTVDALLGAAVFSVLPPTWIAWKLVPISFSALALGMGHRLLSLRMGRRAGALFALLVLLPPRTWLQLSLIGWGNHYEAGALVFVAMLLLSSTHPSRWRTITAGALLGLAMWVGFSATFAVIGTILWLAWRRDWQRLPLLSAGLGVAAVAWTAQYTTAGLHPFARIYHDGEAIPRLSRVPIKLWSLFAPTQLAGLLGMPEGYSGVALGVGYLTSIIAAVGATLRRGRPTTRLGLLLLGVWLSIYVLVRFSVHIPPWPEVPVVHAMRYAAPTYLLLFLLLAATADRWWASGRRFMAIGLLAIPVISGLSARVETIQGRFPEWNALRLEAVEYDFSRGHFAGSLHVLEHQSCRTESPRLQVLHAYAIGKAAMREAAQEHAVQLQWSPTYARKTGGRLTLTTLEVPKQRSHAWLEGFGDGLQLELDQGTYDRSVTVLEDAYAVIKPVPGLSDTERQTILREVAWLQRTSDLHWTDILLPAGTRDLSPLQNDLASAPTAVRNATWWALGRLYTARSIPIYTPVHLHLPDELAPWPDGFLEGVGHALGESWGPLDQIPRPSGLTDEDLPALMQGYREGLDLQWHGDLHPLPQVVEPWEGLEKGVPGPAWRYGLSAL